MRCFKPFRLVSAFVFTTAIVFHPCFARAADDSSAGPTLDEFFVALQGHQWVVAAGVAIYFLVALVKQGYLGAWIAKKIPPAYVPWLALLLSTLSLAAVQLARGTAWQLAIMHALEAAAIAVFSHQTVVEGMRGGKEIVPVAPYAKESIEAKVQ